MTRKEKFDYLVYSYIDEQYGTNLDGLYEEVAQLFNEPVEIKVDYVGDDDGKN